LLHALTDPTELTAVSPKLDGKSPLQWVKGQVAPWAFWVVVWAGELGTGRLEAATGNDSWVRGGTESGASSQHLRGWISKKRN